ncbi:hypothetical protein M9H77_05882 [Catharanthus roseus]|uniref:Uncharacterized protein n=1 Tax=Catharanthus roseus TaxID=4058 RepID=A0ACC0BQJ3_CATRO|nr:hypothetical protein M9H77_05882 [Catharanthus roseus]
MESKMIEKVSKTFIKPSSPTPQSLRLYNLSSYDQILFTDYGSMAYFFLNHPNHHIEISKIRHQLHDSLSKTLIHYYPFAGRLVKNDYIDCSDQGIEFLEVRIHCPILDILKKNTKSYSIGLVFPREMVPKNANQESLVAVQLSHFDCGGIAIGVCLSSKIADGSAATTFMEDWANLSRLSSHVPSPILPSDSHFPRKDGTFPLPFFDYKNCVTRKFIFPAKEIEKLKLKANESGIDQPTRVEVLSALLYGCAMEATKSTITGGGTSVILEAINLRPFLGLPQNTLGNIYSFYFCINKDEEEGIEFPALVRQLREAKLKFKNLPREKLSYESQMMELEKCLKEVKNSSTSNIDVYYFSSFSRLGINKVDFGWGKAEWTTMLQTQSQEMYLFGSIDGNGLEALVTLEEEKMSLFEKNQHLLPFICF